MTAHLNPDRDIPAPGSDLTAGNAVATLGTSGDSDGVHGHVEAAVKDSRLRATALSEIKAQARSVIFESAGFLIALIAAVPACATVVGCAVDGAALVTTGGLLADSGTSIVDNLKLGESATKRADYAYCRMTGESDARCRESAGITDEIDGG